MGLSSISSPGVFSWLSGMGVRQFEAQQPSDLEYDPQVRVVAEWRNPETLFMDHVDNVVTEAMLQGAERGETLRYPWYLLPQGRVAKLYSVVAHALGFHSPIPEGLATDPALQILTFNVIHNAIKRHVLLEADAFRRQQALLRRNGSCSGSPSRPRRTIAVIGRTSRRCARNSECARSSGSPER